MSLLDEIAKTTIELLLKEPFYAYFLSALSKEVSEPKTETLCINYLETGLVLQINPHFWRKQSPEARCGLLKHQVLHLLFNHPIKAGYAGNAFLYNVAADLVVNQFLSGEHLPDGALKPEDFGDLLLEKEQTTDYYFEKLLEAWEGRNWQSPSFACLQDLEARQEAFFDAHRPWYQPLKKIEAELLEIKLETSILGAIERGGAKAVGQLPDSLQRILGDLGRRENPAVNWRRMLRLFAESSVKTRIRNTIRRPSKRYGTTPGILVRNKQKLLLAVDTSGSIRASELDFFFKEIFHIWKRGAEVFLLECDSVVRKTSQFRGKIPAFAQGGGRTDFNPVLEYANGPERFDALIYFTDGYALTPRKQTRIPVLWVISEGGLSVDNPLFKALPGRKLKIR